MRISLYNAQPLICKKLCHFLRKKFLEYSVQSFSIQLLFSFFGFNLNDAIASSMVEYIL